MGSLSVKNWLRFLISCGTCDMKDLETLYPYQQVPISRWTCQFESMEDEQAFLLSKLPRDKKIAQYLSGIIAIILIFITFCDPMIVQPEFWPEITLILRGKLIFICIAVAVSVNYIKTVKQLQYIRWCFVIFLFVHLQSMTLLFNDSYIFYVCFDVIILISLYFSALFSFKSSCIVGLIYCVVAVILLFILKSVSLHAQLMVCAAYVSTNLAGAVISAHEHIIKRQLYVRNKWLKALAKEMKVQAFKDALTQLPNRRAFNAHFPRYQDEAEYESRKVYVAIADIDFFKYINDTYGHDVGDAALIEFSQTLIKTLQSNDALFRLGGEEFVMILPMYTYEEIKGLFNKIILQLNKNIFNIKEIEHPITASFGVTALIPNEKSKEVLARADSALYKAKNNGRNQFIIEGTD